MAVSVTKRLCLAELLMVLGGRVGQVVEDYDATKCSALYYDSGFISSSPRPEAVSMTSLVCVWLLN